MALGQDSDEFSVEDDSEEDAETSSAAGEQLHHCAMHSSCAIDSHQPAGLQASGCKVAAAGLFWDPLNC